MTKFWKTDHLHTRTEIHFCLHVVCIIFSLARQMIILIPGEHIADTMVLLKLIMSTLTFLHLTLQDPMACYYRTNVVVTESTATSIQLTTMKHSSDGRSVALWKEERRLRITSSNVGKIAVHHQSRSTCTPDTALYI